MFPFICLDTYCKNTKPTIKYWYDNDEFQGGSKQVRFQPSFGKFLATATENNIKIFDVETDSLLYNLEVTFELNAWL